MLVIEINTIRSQALERVLNHLPDVIGSAIQSYCAINRETKLAGDGDFVAERCERFADKRFVRPVNLAVSKNVTPLSNPARMV
jgi:hypothetical protein